MFKLKKEEFTEYGSFISSDGKLLNEDSINIDDVNELINQDSTLFKKTEEKNKNNDRLIFITDNNVNSFEETKKTFDYLKKLLLGYSDDEDYGDKIFNNFEKRMFLSKVDTVFITDGDDVSFEEPATFFVGIYSPKIRILDMIFAIILTPQGCSAKATLNQFMELAQEFAKRSGI